MFLSTLAPSTFGYREFAMAILVTAGLCIIAASLAPEIKEPYADERGYISHALSLKTHQTLGFYPAAGQSPEPSGWAAPLYPMMLAALIEFSPSLEQDLRCLVLDNGSLATCQGDLSMLLYLNTTMVFIFALGVYWTAWRLSASQPASIAAVVIAFGAQRVIESMTLFLTESLILALVGIFTAALTEIITRKRLSAALICGLTLGLLALTRPSYGYLIWPMIIIGMIAVLRTNSKGVGLNQLLGLATGIAITCLPWMIYNAETFSQFALSSSLYGGKTLAQRIAFNAMTVEQWFAAWVYWLPDFGDNLARRMFGASTVAPLDWHSPDSFYRIGKGEILAQATSESGGREHALGYLLRHEILEHPLRHTLVSLPLAFRGMMSGYWALVGWITSIFMIWIAMSRRVWTIPLLFGPCLFMILFHAAVSVSIPRYNTLMIPLLSIAMAWAAQGIFERFRPTRQATPS